MAVSESDGSLIVSDAFWGRVLRFSSDGDPISVLGKRGEGPGELKDPGAVAMVDGQVFVADPGKTRIVVFDAESGSLVREVAYEGALTSFSEGPGGVWLGLQNVNRKTSLGLLPSPDGRIVYRGLLPKEFHGLPPLAGIYNGIAVVAAGDTVLAGYMGINRLTAFRPDGTEIRSTSVPVRQRKGEMPELNTRFASLDFPEMFSANSALFRMHRLPSGHYALVHYDQEIDGELITARVYLTLLSRDFSSACPDLEIPVSADSQPYTAFTGSDLLVLQQQVAEDGRASAVVDRYRILDDACFAPS